MQKALSAEVVVVVVVVVVAVVVCVCVCMPVCACEGAGGGGVTGKRVVAGVEWAGVFQISTFFLSKTSCCPSCQHGKMLVRDPFNTELHVFEIHCH